MTKTKLEKVLRNKKLPKDCSLVVNPNGNLAVMDRRKGFIGWLNMKTGKVTLVGTIRAL